MKQKTIYAKRSTFRTVVLNVLLISVFLFSSCNKKEPPNNTSPYYLDLIVTRYINRTEYTIQVEEFKDGVSKIYTIDPNNIFGFSFAYDTNQCIQFDIENPEITNPQNCLLRLADSIELTFDNVRKLKWRNNDIENNLNLLNNEDTQILRNVVNNNSYSGNLYYFNFDFTEALYEQATSINAE